MAAAGVEMMSMKRWSVTGTVVAGMYVGEYEAETAEEACRKAARDIDVSVCHQCSRKISDPEVEDLHAEEIDE